MDPKVCLMRASVSLADGDYRDALHCVRLYNTWRSNGGFAPEIDGVHGDEIARLIGIRAACRKSVR